MSALPVGQHLVCIVNAEARTNAKGTGTFAALTMECIGEKDTGKTHTDRLNLQNPSDKAVRIATERLALYLGVLGLKGAALSDPQDVCFLPFIVDIVAGKDADHREVKTLLPCPQDWKAAADAACAQLRARLPTPPAPLATAQAGTVAMRSPNVVGLADFVGNLQPPFYVVQRMLQAGSLYAFTASWGAGKTAFSVSLAMHVAAGIEWAGKRVEKSKVLYLCGENPADVKLRVWKTAEVFGISWDAVVDNIHFTQRPFAIDNEQALDAFVAEAIAALNEGEAYGLVIVDTGPAHSEAEDENDNRQMHKLAMALRELMRPLGQPATLVLMHPVKNATRETLEPRGGGAFSGSVDGLIFGWRESVESPMEVYHKTKFRGPGFAPLFFKMETHAITGLADNFGDPVETVVAVHTEEQPEPKAKKLSPSQQAVMNYMASCATIEPPPEVLKYAHYKRPTKVVPQATLMEGWLRYYSSQGKSDPDPDTPRRRLATVGKKLAEDLDLLRFHTGYWWLTEWEVAVERSPPELFAAAN